MPSLDALRAAAAEQATALSSDFVGTEHLFLAWLANARGPIADAMSAAGLTADTFLAVLAKSSKRGRGRRGPTGTESGGLTSHAQKVIDQATERARQAGRDAPSADDLVLAMVQEPRGAIARALSEFDIKPSRLKAIASDRPAPRKPVDQAREDAPAARERSREARPPREERPPRQGRRERATASVPEAEPEPPRAPEEPPRRAARLEVESGRRISWLTPLYLAVPAAVVLYFLEADPIWLFVTGAIGILPLAGLMGQATEQLAERTGPTMGGLLNATFGNAAELIIAIVALRAGLVDLVKASITGSILGNLLLILGLALMAGGTRKPMLRFNRTNAGMSSAMLALAVAGLVFPTLFHATHPEAAVLVELHFSEIVAGVLIAAYLLSLLFVLRTHKPLFGGGQLQHHDLSGTWSVGKALGLLLLATIGVGGLSEILVHAVQPVSESFGISQVFVGLILIPIIGNAAEHGTAVTAARRGHTDLAFQIALGSSTQIALLVAPLLVFVGAFMGQPGMNLVFSPFEVLGLGMAVIVSAIITLDGESHWFEGVQLLALYSLIGVAAWFI